MEYFLIGVAAIACVLTTNNTQTFRVTRGAVNCDGIKNFVERNGHIALRAAEYHNQTRSNGLGTYRGDFVDTTLGDILSRRTPALQYKVIPKDEGDALSNYLKTEGYYEENVRVCSAPWTFDAHFDCFDNTARVVYGSKIFTFFRMIDRSAAEQKDILKTLARKGTEEAVSILKDQYNIHSDTVRLRAGDEVFIPTGVYHFVEGDEPSILINTKKNIPSKDNAVKCDGVFRNLWPNQKQICKDNKCLY